MNETIKTRSCERVDDLISFLYGEADEPNDFEGHLKSCKECQNELASFGHVRHSISAWREEALSGFVAQPVLTRVRQKSAWTALREFFDLSPFWLKGAVGFAALLLCVMAVALVMSMTRVPAVQTQAQNSDAKYSQQQLNAAVETALRQERERVASIATPPAEVNPKQLESKPVQVKVSKPESRSTQWGRRSLSKSEREQLAADLRLLSTSDDDSLTLIGEKINQEF
jgi:anti-sigma factor RsiW